ncbi:GNAT family N-acetyltransferase [Amycolatopsis sp. PS_44_ISF1]|uniref:GNAT family N-acetyltransferase n=1 Tax=Amycolatopsis sp. PS_44_ISF1 TaxID=2974917 RepID=UPI0028E04EAE|nr:GNAT family N-acetyltransferase [Amycolatopsis sp. PS_44_ISF1]MDT8914688.1 GNAT family N-acetyltransferase [Amycolatopsis sp. PS_44_ISF1]
MTAALREARYRWHNSTDPRVGDWHRRLDRLASARPRVTVSYPAGDGPVLAYAGIDDGLRHVLPYAEQRRGETRRRRRHRSTWARLDAAEADLLFVGYLAGSPPAPAGRAQVDLPFRVHLVVRPGNDPAAVPARLSRKARQQYQREQRSRDRSLEVATGRADFEYFYHRMHVPTMRRRHGDAARSEPFALARHSLFGRGVLFFLREHGERVAGMLCRREPGALVLRLAGVLGGGADAYRTGTYLGLYVAILAWAADNAVPEVDLSGTEPFLSKGIFQFKRKLHPLVRLPANHFAGKRLRLCVRRDTPAVRDFLVANPVLVPAGRGFEAWYFRDAGRAPRLDLQWRTEGVHGHRIVDLGGFLGGAPCAASPAG